MSSEYSNERCYSLVDWLEGGDVLVKAEYGSLLSESMLGDATFEQFAKTIRKLEKGQYLRIRMEVLNSSEENAHEPTPH